MVDNITIRELTRLEEMSDVEALQQVVWPDPTTVIYRNTLINLIRNGGQIIGALDGNKLVGFVLSYLGNESPESDRPAMANLKLVSQRMGILPDYRDRGIGYDLKMAQRNYAVKLGIRLITWTFDPLQTRNAHLNIRKLGAVVRYYWRDFYGTLPSPQVVLGSSDRLIAEWWVTSNRAEQRANGKRTALALPQYMAGAEIINPSLPGPGNFSQPGLRVQPPQGMVILIEVPENYNAMVEQEPTLAKDWRNHTRELIEHTLGSGYTITDFVRGVYEDRQRSFYALSLADAPVGGFSIN